MSSVVERVAHKHHAAKKLLLDRIAKKTAVLGVVGLGYVGLPLAVEKAKAGYRVVGFDIQPSRVQLVNDGVNYIGDVVDTELAELVNGRVLTATTDYDRISEVDAVMICVPTPLDKYKQPDTSYVENSAREIAKRMHRAMLVVLESTTYPGTTEEIVKPILEESGLVCGRDFFIAFSPERVDPGNKVYNTKNTPKVVGGVTEHCTEVAAALYRSVLEGEVHTVSSPGVAEMEKILENTFRHVNIALVNEMAVLCYRMGIDIWEVIDAAASKPYGFMPFYPGPGPGGHCIPIDPFYLSYKAREFDYHTRLIELAGEINSYMPEFVVERVSRLLNRESKALRGARILLLGVAYKKDIDDLRESPALRVLELLEKEGARVVYNDPFIPSFTRRGRDYSSVELTAETLAAQDLVVITTNHSAYDYRFITEHAKLVFDTRNATAGPRIPRDRVERL